MHTLPLQKGAPFIMGAPNLCVDTPAMWEFSKKMNVPISGKDFKSGQTLDEDGACSDVQDPYVGL